MNAVSPLINANAVALATGGEDEASTLRVRSERGWGAVEWGEWLPMVTLTVWVVVLAVGGAGWVWGYARPRAEAAPVPAVQAVKLDVDLKASNPSAASVRRRELPRRDPVERVQRTEERVPAVATPRLVPMVDWAVPTTIPVAERVVERAAESTLEERAELKPEAVENLKGGPGVSENAIPLGGVVGEGRASGTRRLTYGQGEGRQPAPEYPRQARRERQEGSVGVRFVVGADGRVMSAELSAASVWPLLNEAALRVIREQWRFSAGEVRVYEVGIRFELRK